MADRIPWWEPRIGEAEKALVLEVLGSNYVNDGEMTTRFENRVRELLGCRHAIGVSNCTSALFLALKALDIGAGDQVIVPDATFIATANAVAMTDATAVLVDVDADSLTMSPAAFEATITPHTRAVIPVHVSGRAADLAAILAIAEAHAIAVVEDAAEAFMSRHDGKALGTIGRMGCLSFSPMKLITTGQGGMVVTDDDELHVRLRQLKDQGRPVRGTGGDDHHPKVGYNFKLTNIQAAVGLGQLETIDARMDHVRHVRRLYERHLAGQNGITLLPAPMDRGALPLWVDAIVEGRDGLAGYLQARAIDCRAYWHPIHTQPCYKAGDAGFPNATRLLPRAVWLPSAFGMSDDQVRLVCGHIGDFLAS